MTAITKVPALGQAWSGNWQARIFERLRVRGFKSVTAFSESRPTASAVEMADELSIDHAAGINHADVAAAQILRIWREEARRGGPEAVERFARRTLVGELHRDLPEGWRADWTSNDPETKVAVSRAARSTGRWICYLGDEHEPAADCVLDAVLDAGRTGRIPPGWLPAGADDPLLVDIFRCHWAEPQASSATSSRVSSAAMPVVRTLTNAAVVCPATLHVEALRSWFERQGWTEVDLESSADNVLRVSVLQRNNDPVATCVFLDAVSPVVTLMLVSLAPELARMCKRTVTCHEILGRNIGDPDPSDALEPPGYDLRVRSFEVTPAGDTQKLDPPFGDESLFEARGGFDETVASVLEEVIKFKADEWSRSWWAYLEPTPS